MSNDELINDVEKLFQMLRMGNDVDFPPKGDDCVEKFNYQIKSDTNGLVFEYKQIAAYGYVGMPAGKSLSVYEDGSIVCRQYVIGKENWEEIAEEEIIACVPNEQSKLKK